MDFDAGNNSYIRFQFGFGVHDFKLLRMFKQSPSFWEYRSNGEKLNSGLKHPIFNDGRLKTQDFLQNTFFFQFYKNLMFSSNFFDIYIDKNKRLYLRY